MILTTLQNLPRNVGDLGKLIAAKGFKKLPKVQKIAKSGHTACDQKYPAQKIPKRQQFFNKIFFVQFVKRYFCIIDDQTQLRSDCDAQWPLTRTGKEGERMENGRRERRTREIERE